MKVVRTVGKKSFEFVVFAFVSVAVVGFMVLLALYPMVFHE